MAFPEGVASYPVDLSKGVSLYCLTDFFIDLTGKGVEHVQEEKAERQQYTIKDRSKKEYP